jgi:hypothetical protein
MMSDWTDSTGEEEVGGGATSDDNVSKSNDDWGLRVEGEEAAEETSNGEEEEVEVQAMTRTRRMMSSAMMRGRGKGARTRLNEADWWWVECERVGSEEEDGSGTDEVITGLGCDAYVATGMHDRCE